MTSANEGQGHWARFEQAMAAGDGDAAQRALEEAVRHEPDQGTAFLRISEIAYRTGQIDVAIDAGLSACKSPPGDLDARMDLAAHLLILGEGEAVRRLCAGIHEDAPPPIHLRAGRILLSLEVFPPAEAAILRAAEGLPRERVHRFLARLHAVMGRLDDAEREYVLAIGSGEAAEVEPGHMARLRTWTVERNHVGMLRRALRECTPGAPVEAGLAFALFKELHDLGEHDEAWTMLERGCASKRARLRYDPDEEARLLDEVARSCPIVPASGDVQKEQAAPVFIVGLPRAGSTVVERMLANHSQVESAGELRDFIVQSRRLCGLPGLEPLDAAFVQRRAGIDPAVLGRRYMAHVDWRLEGRRFFIDKLPFNYLHIGLIRAALPHAKIIHAFREPMDACFSMLRFLFPWLYPFSYDQRELAGYYVGYRKVMAHWHALYPGGILDVSHDALLEDPEGQMRRILAFCDLEYEADLTDLGRNRAPAATGSNAQVRDRVTTRYRGQWRHYADRLEPLRTALEDGGVPVAS